MAAERYFARSASDRTEEWPYWFVADRHKGGLNVTGPLVEQLTGQRAFGACLLSKGDALMLAECANRALELAA